MTTIRQRQLADVVNTVLALNIVDSQAPETLIPQSGSDPGGVRQKKTSPNNHCIGSVSSLSRTRALFGVKAARLSMLEKGLGFKSCFPRRRGGDSASTTTKTA